MADKPLTPGPVAFPVRPEPHPSDEALREPFPYANTIRVGTDPYGVTLTFFSVAPEFLEFPEVKEQARKMHDKPPPPGVEVALRFKLPPVAKVWLPAEFLPEVIKALSTHYSRMIQEREAKRRANGGPRQ